MKTITTTFMVACLLVLASCSKSDSHAIVGRWHEVGTKALGAFHEDGTVELSTGGTQVSGKYSFITGGKLKLELSGKGAALGPRVYAVVIDGDRMSWTDVDGERSEYIKAK